MTPVYRVPEWLLSRIPAAVCHVGVRDLMTLISGYYGAPRIDGIFSGDGDKRVIDLRLPLEIWRGRAG